MERDVPLNRSNAAFSVFLLALGGVTISASALFAIAVGLSWDGMPWTIALFAALLVAMLSSAHVEAPEPRTRAETPHALRAASEAPAGAD